MGEWRQRPLGELTENFDGRRVPVKEADRRPGPYPYYGASGIVDRVDSYLFDGEYLLIAEDGENLRTRNTPIAFLARGKFWVNNHAHIVWGNDQADTRYLMYALQSIDIGAYLTGSTIPKLTQGSMNRIMLPTPDLPEQRAIVGILGSLDDKIELNRSTNETLEAMAQELFKSRFVASDEAEEWDRGEFEDIATLGREAINPGATPDEEFDHFSIPAFDEQRLPARELGSSIKSNKLLVPHDSVLLSKLNPRIPRIWLPQLNGQRRSICSTEFLVAIPREGVSRAWLYGLLSSSEFLDRFTTMVTGTSGSHQRVRPESLLAMPVSVPPKPVMARFAQAADPILGRIGQNLRENKTLAALRDTLLPQLISGEIRVDAKEALVGRGD